MPAAYWMIPIGAAFLGVALAVLTLWKMRRQRQTRLALRVLAGRRRILGEEIDARLEGLEGIDDGDVQQRAVAATAMIDDLHMVLLERQAHLQNLEDLAHLQRHKIAVLTHHLDTPLAPAPEAQDTAASPETTAVGPAGPAGREALENTLLGQVRQHAEPPPTRHQRRRR